MIARSKGEKQMQGALNPCCLFDWAARTCSTECQVQKPSLSQMNDPNRFDERCFTARRPLIRDSQACAKTIAALAGRGVIEGKAREKGCCRCRILRGGHF